MPRKPRSSKDLKAIPTSFNGIQYRSRLEARFAEFLFNSQEEFEYEKLFPGSAQGYRPDFYLKKWRLYVEVKPSELLSELDVFDRDIMPSRWPWICVDSRERGQWSVICTNPAARARMSLNHDAKLEADGETLVIKVSQVWILLPSPEPPVPAPIIEQPAGEGTAKLYFAKMRELLGAEPKNVL